MIKYILKTNFILLLMLGTLFNLSSMEMENFPTKRKAEEELPVEEKKQKKEEPLLEEKVSVSPEEYGEKLKNLWVAVFKNESEYYLNVRIRDSNNVLLLNNISEESVVKKGHYFTLPSNQTFTII